jgi:hypothetical protein
MSHTLSMNSILGRCSAVVLLAVIVVSLSLLSGCKKEETSDNTVDEYYVKYDVNSTTIYSGGKLNVNLNDENGGKKSFSIDQRALWSIVIGPVQRGFKADMAVDAINGGNNQLRLYTNIYVSKNGSPFALKATDGSDTPRDAVQISYTIDY